jgi:hypothetical protein
MEKNHSTYNSLRRKRIKPFVRWHKDTDEWECRAIVEIEDLEIEPTTADDYNKEHLNRNKQIGEYMRQRTIQPPPPNPVLQSISRLVAYLISIQRENRLPPNIFKHNLSKDIQIVDEWLEKKYSKPKIRSNGSMQFVPQ